MAAAWLASWGLRRGPLTALSAAAEPGADELVDERPTWRSIGVITCRGSGVGGFVRVRPFGAADRDEVTSCRNWRVLLWLRTQMGGWRS